MRQTERSRCRTRGRHFQERRCLVLACDRQRRLSVKPQGVPHAKAPIALHRAGMQRLRYRLCCHRDEAWRLRACYQAIVCKRHDGNALSCFLRSTCCLGSEYDEHVRPRFNQLNGDLLLGRRDYANAAAINLKIASFHKSGSADVLGEFGHLMNAADLDHIIIRSGTTAGPFKWPPHASARRSANSRPALP